MSLQAIPTDGRGPYYLLYEWVAELEAASSDSQKLAFVGFPGKADIETEDRPVALYVTNTQVGSQPIKLDDSVTSVSNAFFSPDSRFLYFTLHGLATTPSPTFKCGGFG